MDKNNLNHKKLIETKKQNKQLDISLADFVSYRLRVNLKPDPLREFLTSIEP